MEINYLDCIIIFLCIFLPNLIYFWKSNQLTKSDKDRIKLQEKLNELKEQKKEMLRHKSAMDDFVEFTKIDRKITLVENKISTLVVPDTRLSFFSILFEYFVPLAAAFWYYDTPVIRLENDYLYPMSYPLSIGQESTLIIGFLFCLLIRRGIWLVLSM
eukprot:TRINITY_DN5862_c0_g1_i5.p1 TRINITY_DN5862_c0_g1~~TRINITY_DN5862_c0_g1_i5.p1  ORF type:complete len:158 (-),score=27.13 TRINITY_DN5862_c0_g1_i5:94-567(-)